ncbi:MAG: ABC transporter permease subunit [Desulfobacterota bacterium]|nr:ABC transporter permease subunit [Thermodesulfobacteriota bacterium]
MKLWIISAIGIKECFRRRILYGMFLTAGLFIFLVRGCDSGTVRGERLLLDAEARASIAVSIAFHGIALWSFVLCSVLSMSVLARELDNGTALLTLSRPIRHGEFVAGKLLSAFIVSIMHLATLAIMLLVFVPAPHRWKIVLGTVFLVPALMLCTLMTSVFSLITPRVIAPLLAMMVYGTSCWAALPYYFDKLRLIWTPSPAITRAYQFLPCFGDLQFIGAAVVRGASFGEHLTGTVLNTIVYCVGLWIVNVILFSRRQRS